MALLDQIKYQFKTGGVSIKIIYINVLVYALFLILGNIFALMKWNPQGINNIDDYFSFNSSPLIFLKRPWTILTYMFLHGSFWHIFNNMLIYFFTARMYEDLMGKKSALSTYIIGGFCGAILYLITHNLFPLFRDMGDIPMLGASAAVMAVFVGLATYTPNFEVMLFGIIKIKMKYLAMVWVAFDIVGLSNSDGIAHFAHLGGAFWGYLYVSNFKKGKDAMVASIKDIPGVADAGWPQDISLWIFMSNPNAGHDFDRLGYTVCNGAVTNFGVEKGYSITFWNPYNKKEIGKFRCY